MQNPISIGSPESPRPSVVMTPRTDFDHAPQFEPFNPQTISPEAFWALPGSVQEFVLKDSLKNGDKQNVDRLRPDFKMHHPLSDYEILFTRALRNITASEESIDQASDYVFMSSFLPLDEASRIRAKEQIESEKMRRKEDPNSLYYSHENIAGYEPGRRYRVLLEDQVAFELAEEAIASKEAEDEEARRRAYDAKILARDRRIIAEVRADLVAIQGGLSSQEEQVA